MKYQQITGHQVVLTLIAATTLAACVSSAAQEETKARFVARALTENLAEQEALKTQLNDYEKALDFWLKEPFKSAVIQHAKARIGDGHIVNANRVCEDGHFTQDGKARLPPALTTNDEYCQMDYSGSADFAGKKSWSNFAGELGLVRGDICVHGDMLREPEMLNQPKVPKGFDLTTCREAAERYATVYTELERLQRSESAIRARTPDANR